MASDTPPVKSTSDLAAKCEELVVEKARVEIQLSEVLDALRNIELQLANVVDHCYQEGKMHCSGCEGSIGVSLQIARRIVPSTAKPLPAVVPAREQLKEWEAKRRREQEEYMDYKENLNRGVF